MSAASLTLSGIERRFADAAAVYVNLKN